MDCWRPAAPGRLLSCRASMARCRPVSLLYDPNPHWDHNFRDCRQPRIRIKYPLTYRRYREPSGSPESSKLISMHKVRNFLRFLAAVQLLPALESGEETLVGGQ